jgi:hypothetical protein
MGGIVCSSMKFVLDFKGKDVVLKIIAVIE